MLHAHPPPSVVAGAAPFVIDPASIIGGGALDPESALGEPPAGQDRSTGAIGGSDVGTPPSSRQDRS